METIRLVAEPADESKRVDIAVAQKQNRFSRSNVQKMADNGHLFVNGEAAQKNTQLKAGDVVELRVPDVPLPPQPEQIPLDIIYEDDCLLVVNKTQGMAVYPGHENSCGTLANALLWHCGGGLSRIDPMRPGIVHRLDRFTSGLLVCAKTDEAHRALAAQMEAHTALRRYEGVVRGCPNPPVGTVDAPIARHPVHRTRMCIAKSGGRNAVTHYEVLARYKGFSRCSFRLETGRTHQIRVHMSHLGNPLAGDSVYAPNQHRMGLAGQCLHAAELGFKHPLSGESLLFRAEIPAWFHEFIMQLENNT